MKVVLLNAPPRAGKDTAAQGIINALQSHSACGHPLPYVAGLHKMADTLKRGVHLLLGVDMSPAELEDSKDTPLPEFIGKTPRQAYIAASEGFMKPFFGARVFGNIFVNRIRAAARMAEVATGSEYLCVCSDLGFYDELLPLIEAFGADNILMLRVTRAGCDFSNDSRSYLNHPDVKLIEIINDGSVNELQYKAYQFTLSWLKTKKTDNAYTPAYPQTCMA